VDAAKSKQVARELLDALALVALSKNPLVAGTRQVAIDVPECNAVAVSVCKEMKFSPVWQCARMYTKGPLNQKYKDCIFGLNSWEIGP